MNGDDIADAFSRWKVAHDAFLALEQQYFDTVRADAHHLIQPDANDSDQLLIQVQVLRAHAENLLLAAMKLLHERRQREAGTHEVHDGPASMASTVERPVLHAHQAPADTPGGPSAH
jgi:hypothetical protein